MRKKSCQKDWPRVPARYEGVQVNGCNSPECANFYVSPIPEERVFKESNRETLDRQPAKRYEPFRLQGSGANTASLVCKSCEERKKAGMFTGTISTAIKSNKAVAEELERISHYLADPPVVCPGCGADFSSKAGTKIKKRGKTAAGAQRYECLCCKKTFTPSKANRTQRRPEINKQFFKLLVNRVPFRRIAEILSIHPQTLYGKIDFLHRQCLTFVGRRESTLQEMDFDRLYLASDRQVQVSNWTQRKDKRNCEIYGIATACLRTGYLFAFNFNFDAACDADEIESMALAAGDYDRPKYHREYARVWLKREFQDATKKGASNKNNNRAPGSLLEEIEQKADFDSRRNLTESSENLDGTIRLPAKGVLVHNEYTMIAHFFLLRRLFDRVGKTRFFMDQDSGIKNAYMAAFRDKIDLGESDGFLINASKDKTVDAKRRDCRASHEAIGEHAGMDFRDMTYEQRKKVVNDMIMERLQKPLAVKYSPEQWIMHPLATMAESEKMVAAITQVERYSLLHQANLFRKASLHAVDRFFMQIRRAVMCFERPFGSGTSGRRVWYGYAPYDPQMYTKLGDIYRVYYNYCKANGKGETPAMRLGLAKGPVELEKIIYLDKYQV